MRITARHLSSESGYVRTAPPIYDPRGVRWWLVMTNPDGTFSVRGGVTRTCRLARRAIEQAREELKWEIFRESQQPTHEMMRDGSLREFAAR